MSKFLDDCWVQAEEWANARAAERNYNTRSGAQLEIDEGAKLGKLFEELEQLRTGEKAADVEIERLRAEVAEALSYLSRLFTAYAPQCTPLRTLPGVCTQIDNMLTALRDVAKLKAENAELRAAVVDYFSMPSSEKKRAIRLKFKLPIPCDHQGIGRPGCFVCDPRQPKPGAGANG